jgi:putative addiction module component (TIGR02574 family)
VRATEIPNFDQLTDLERVRLAEDLLASVRNPNALPLPISHRIELERRWAAFEQNPKIALSSDQFWSWVSPPKR